MPKGIEITVRKKLVAEKRDLNVYHRATNSAYMISHGNAITLPPGPPVWQLKITRSFGYMNTTIEDYIIIGDGEHRLDEGLKKIKITK
jgi:hypothetical protein